MRVSIAKGPPTERLAGLQSDCLSFLLKWPGGMWRDYMRSRPSATVASLKRRLAELDPDQREAASIKAVIGVWAKAGGRRQRTVATWHHGDKETLFSFLVRAKAECAKFKWPSSPVREDAWIDESDL